MIFNGPIHKQVRERNMQIVDFMNKLYGSTDPGLFIYRKFGVFFRKFHDIFFIMCTLMFLILQCMYPFTLFIHCL